MDYRLPTNIIVTKFEFKNYIISKEVHHITEITPYFYLIVIFYFIYY